MCWTRGVTYLALVSTALSTAIFEEVDPPDFSDLRHKAWISPGPPYESLGFDSLSAPSPAPSVGERRDWAPKTLQQHVREERKISNNNFFLPGLGIVKDYLPSQLGPRSQRAPAILPSANLEQQGVAPPVPSRVIFEEKPLSPVSMVVEELGTRHPVSHGEGVDLGLERGGGMSCEKKCTYSTGEPVCTTAVTDVCEDVPEEVCETVMEKSCRTVQEEVCDDPDNPEVKTECSVVMEEVCKTVQEQQCRQEKKMSCSTVEKEACTSLTEPVCSVTTESACVEEMEEHCSLVQDAVCRNVTETRFDEKCWAVEETACRTIYDTVWDQKCESVNVTVPQRDCESREEAEVEMKCRVEKESMLTPVCVTVMDKSVEEDCQDVTATQECFSPVCTNLTIPVLTKQCQQTMEERCEVIIETKTEQQCTEVEQVEYEESCSTTYSQECSTTQEYVCQEAEAVAPTDGYGVPEAPVSTSYSSPGRGPKSFTAFRGQRHTQGVDPAASSTVFTTPSSPEEKRKVKQGRYGSRWRRKNYLRKTLKKTEGQDEASSRSDDYEYEYVEDYTEQEEAPLLFLEEHRRKRRGAELELGEEDHHLLQFQDWSVKESDRRRRNIAKEELEEVEAEVEGKELKRSANWPNSFKGVGGVFQQLGPSSFKSNYYGQSHSVAPTTKVATSYGRRTTQAPHKYSKPTTSATTPAPSCSYVPKETCNNVPKEECKQVAKPTSKQVCLDVPVATPRQECRAVPREECEVVETSRQQETCSVTALPRTMDRRCSSRVVEQPREQCTEVAMDSFREVCEPVPRMINTVECETRMKEIELKEICIDIDIQLPREECKQEEREECRFEPKEVVVQRCEPTVREVCSPRPKVTCTDKCVEKCEDQDKRVCMTMPMEECKEVEEPVCQAVDREQCGMVPREQCQEVAGPLVPGQCRTNTRLDCSNSPRQRCGKTYRSICRKENTEKCTDRREEDCAMECEPVYWCKMCK